MSAPNKLINSLNSPASDALFKKVYEHAPTGVVIASLQGVFCECNAAYSKLVGYTEDELQHLSISDLVHPEDHQANFDAIQRLMAGEIANYEIENRYLHKDGTAVWVRKFVSTLPGENGEPAYLMALVTDVSAYKQTEMALRESNAKLKKVLEVETVGVMFWDLKTGRMTDANNTFLETMGYSRHDLETGTLTWQTLTPPEYIEASLAEVKKFETTGRVGPYEKEYFCKDGTRRWFIFAGSALGDNHCVEFCVDISANKQATAKLFEMNSTFQEAQRNAHLGTFEYLAATQTTVWSEEEYRIYGLAPEQPSPTYQDLLQNYIHPDDAALLHQCFTEATQNTAIYDLEHRIVRPDGSIRWVHDQAYPYFDDSGRLLRYVGTTLDITERKRAELALAESEQRWHFALDGAGDGLWDWNAATNQVFFSKQWKTMLGFAEDEIGDTLDEWDKRVHPDDKEAVYQEINKLFAQEIPIYISEHRVLCKDGRYKWILDRGKVVSWAADGKPLRVIGTHSDISERKAVEEERYKISVELKNSEQRFRLAMEAAVEGIWDWELDTGFVYYSPGYATMLGYQPEQLPQNLNTWLDLIHPADMPIASMAKKCLLDFGHYALEFRMRCRLGDYRWILCRGKVVEYHLDGMPKRAVGTHVDITELKQARQDAERLAKVKTEFLANMAHELRTPMNAVLGFSQLLKQCKLDADPAQFVEKISASGHTLLRLINDTLDFSKIEAGQYQIESAPFNLQDIIDDIAGIMVASWGQRDVEMVIKPPVGIDGLMGDRKVIQQVLTNLVSNAIKFTSQGLVELHIQALQTTADEQVLRFSVRDSGIGIAEDRRDNLFAAFTQADTSINRRFGGTGLGLAISQKLVQLMGGTITLHSEEGQGSEFSFELSLQRIQDSEAVSTSLSELDVLIAIDSEASREAVMKIIQHFNWRADIVDSADAALGHVISHYSRKNRYDALFIEWPMASQNDLDVLETVRNIKKSLLIQFDRPQQLPVFVITSATNHDKLKTHPHYAWVDNVLIKPVTASSIYNAINTIVTKKHDLAALGILQQPVIQHDALAGIRVLVVDDHDINRELAHRLLKNEGAATYVVENGLEACRWLRMHPEAVDIVLMDVQMPIMDGGTATRIIREDERWRDLPILALSAGVFKEEQEAALAAGMNDFLAKPFLIEDMVAKIKQLTGDFSGVDADRAGRPDRRDDECADMIQAIDETVPEIDFQKGLEVWKDGNTYCSYLKLFFETYQLAANEIKQWIAQDDIAQALKAIHKLKGGAGALALSKIADQAKTLEAELKQGHAEVALIDALQAAIDKIPASIVAWQQSTAVSKPMDLPQSSADSSSSVAHLLSELLIALEQNNPAMAEPILASLQHKIPDQAFENIQDQLIRFEFRQAAQLTQAALDALPSPQT